GFRIHCPNRTCCAGCLSRSARTFSQESGLKSQTLGNGCCVFFCNSAWNSVKLGLCSRNGTWQFTGSSPVYRNCQRSFGASTSSGDKLSQCLAAYFQYSASRRALALSC